MHFLCSLIKSNMRGGNLYKHKGGKLPIILIALLWLTFVILIWEKNPLLASFVSIQARFDMAYAGTHNRGPYLNLANDGRPHSDANIIHNGSKDITDMRIKKVVSDGEESHPHSSSEIGNSSLKLETLKRCNYGKGRWVADQRPPFYSGFRCHQWLSPMWACRAMNRPDFSFENFRWQPEGEGCELPEFQGSTFLKRMQDKTIALVGDSLGRQQFQSLMCMVTGGEKHREVQDVGREYGITKDPGAVRPNGWAYRFPSTNTTILYYWSASLCDLEPLNASDSKTGYAMHLDRPVAFLKEFLHRFDVLVLNTGHHWNRGKFTANRWEMYVGGEPNTERKLRAIWDARNFAVRSVAGWLGSQLPRFPRLKAFFRTTSPRHFVNGDWNTGGSCDNTVPLAGGSEVVSDGYGDPDTEGAVEGTGVWLLGITALSKLRDEAHVSKYGRSGQGFHDCLHWCLPGVPDTWNEILAAQL